MLGRENREVLKGIELVAAESLRVGKARRDLMPPSQVVKPHPQAFFGKGLGALGWAVVSDTSPKEIAGLSGALFNTFGNIASITTPIVIGYIIQSTGSFNGALLFVAANALVAMLSYLVVVGEIKRVVLTKAQST